MGKRVAQKDDMLEAVTSNKRTRRVSDMGAGPEIDKLIDSEVFGAPGEVPRKYSVDDGAVQGVGGSLRPATPTRPHSGSGTSEAVPTARSVASVLQADVTGRRFWRRLGNKMRNRDWGPPKTSVPSRIPGDILGGQPAVVIPLNRAVVCGEDHVYDVQQFAACPNCAAEERLPLAELLAHRRPMLLVVSH